MDIIEQKINTKNYLTKSNLPASDYVINPYVGCTHACKYCYARFMKRFTGHREEWGKFSYDNAPMESFYGTFENRVYPSISVFIG